MKILKFWCNIYKETSKRIVMLFKRKTKNYKECILVTRWRSNGYTDYSIIKNGHCVATYKNKRAIINNVLVTI